MNIGTRQQGRLRAENVIDTDHDEEQIINAIKKALFDTDFIEKVNNTKNPYGDGKSAKRIVDILEQISLNLDLVQKRIAYEI